MGFRDDREAGVQRIEVLERELATTKNELEAATLRAAEVDDLRKRMVALGGERDALKSGVEPRWAVRTRNLRAAIIVLVTLVAVGTGMAAWSIQRDRVRQRALDAQRDSIVAQHEASIDAMRRERDAARSELAQIDGVHAEEIARLQRSAYAAQSRPPDAGQLFVAHVTSRSGAVPSGVEDECVMAIRSVRDTRCVAAIVCGDRRVFPFIEPAPDVDCGIEGGHAWHVGDPEPLAYARATVRPEWPLLLDYDGRAQTLVVRETGAPQFELHMRVTDTLPFELR